MNSRQYGALMLLGLAGMSIGIGYEISAMWAVKQNWSKLLSSAGILAISLYLFLFILSLVTLLKSAWRGETVNEAKRKLELPLAIRWLSVVGLLLIYTYIYLFSLWQPILSLQPWSQLLLAMGLAQSIPFIVAPHRAQKVGWSALVLTLGIFLYPRVIQEMRALFVNSIIYRTATIAGFAIVLSLIFALYSTYTEKLRFVFVACRERLRSLRFLAIVLLCLTPILHRYLVYPETYILYDDIRFTILVVAVWMVAYLGLTGSTHLVSRESLGLSLGVLLFTSFLARSSLFIMDYPFSLSWSEGNRFYDYSLMFAQSLYNYQGHISDPYSSPGRYGLWGILFLWPGLPIWTHRLWNLVLQTLPVLIFSALLTRKLTPLAVRYGVLILITLLLTVLAPLHPPFIIASAIAILFAFDDSLVKRGIALAIAGLYAGLSRWTWAFAPAAIGVLIDLILYYPKRTGSLWHRLFPSILLAALGLVFGLFPSMSQYFSLAQGESVTSGQPLLWYRLFPNDTLGPGVLFLALRYTLPLWIILAWWMISGHWQLDWLQKTAIWGALLGFFAIGLVISVKIGGGGDLHNLDMYLITLLVVMVLGLVSLNRTQIEWPVWVVALFSFLLFWVVYPFVPLHPASDYHPRLNLANGNRVSEALDTVRRETDRSAKTGEVLVMDHRQLLTFGYLPAIPFVPDYEKKYMMDQAMANNAHYFDEYYQDLAKKRFALIVTEPLRTKRREDLGGPFSEENDAWVVWVSNPTLCFYEPLYVSTDVNLELLVPKQNPSGCEEYLN